MPTNVVSSTLSLPASLGKVFPGASYATVSVPLTQNIQPVKNTHDGTQVVDNEWNGIFITALPGNTSGAYIYICNSSSAPDLTGYTNVIGYLSPGGQFARSKEWSNTRDLSKLFVGATNATDAAFVVIDAF